VSQSVGWSVSRLIGQSVCQSVSQSETHCPIATKTFTDHRTSVEGTNYQFQKWIWWKHLFFQPKLPVLVCANSTQQSW